MLVVVSQAGAAVPTVRVLTAESGSEGATTTGTEAKPKEAPNPILPVGKEIAYAVVGFLLLFLVMRLALFPRLRKGMDARYNKIKGDHETAESVRQGALSQAAAYEAGIAEARAEANHILEVARAEVEADRQAKLAAASARIAERKQVANAETEAAKQAALGQVEDAVADVAAIITGRVLGTNVDASSIRDVVRDVVHTGVAK